MILISEDKKRTVEIGSADIWMSLYSTIVIRIKNYKKKVPKAVDLFVNGKCDSADALETARQFNLIRDELSNFSPEKAVYDLNNPKVPAPWANKLSPVITSCANMYTTSDGKDLLFEIVSILTYAGISKLTINLQ